jgi:superoxide dismutase, Cu-Zn family
MNSHTYKLMNKTNVFVAFAALTTLGFTSTGSLRAADAVHAEAWTSVKQATAVLHPTVGNKCQGTVRFMEVAGGVKVVADIEGLNPSQKHAFHIHQYGDCSAPAGGSAGGHYNPENHPHGLPDSEKRHAGDLGNIQADSNGKVHYEITVKNVTIAGTKNPIIGRGVIVHANPDDGGQPVGNAGGRIACGVIGVAATEAAK